MVPEQGSTTLWEALCGDLMDEILHTHHRVVRQAISQRKGYEVFTEGDAFVVAFHMPEDALDFAVDLQVAMLCADWPSELLEQSDCCEVWVRRHSAQQPSSSPAPQASKHALVGDLSALAIAAGSNGGGVRGSGLGQGPAAAAAGLGSAPPASGSLTTPGGLWAGTAMYGAWSSTGGRPGRRILKALSPFRRRSLESAIRFELGLRPLAALGRFAKLSSNPGVGDGGGGGGGGGGGCSTLPSIGGPPSFHGDAGAGFPVLLSGGGGSGGGSGVPYGNTLAGAKDSRLDRWFSTPFARMSPTLSMPQPPVSARSGHSLLNVVKTSPSAAAVLAVEAITSPPPPLLPYTPRPVSDASTEAAVTASCIRHVPKSEVTSAATAAAAAAEAEPGKVSTGGGSLTLNGAPRARVSRMVPYLGVGGVDGRCIDSVDVYNPPQAPADVCSTASGALNAALQPAGASADPVGTEAAETAEPGGEVHDAAVVSEPRCSSQLSSPRGAPYTTCTSVLTSRKPSETAPTAAMLASTASRQNAHVIQSSTSPDMALSQLPTRSESPQQPPPPQQQQQWECGCRSGLHQNGIVHQRPMFDTDKEQQAELGRDRDSGYVRRNQPDNTRLHVTLLNSTSESNKCSQQLLENTDGVEGDRSTQLFRMSYRTGAALSLEGDGKAAAFNTGSRTDCGTDGADAGGGGDTAATTTASACGAHNSRADLVPNDENLSTGAGGGGSGSGAGAAAAAAAAAVAIAIVMDGANDVGICTDVVGSAAVRDRGRVYGSQRRPPTTEAAGTVSADRAPTQLPQNLGETKRFANGNAVSRNVDSRRLLYGWRSGNHGDGGDGGNGGGGDTGEGENAVPRGVSSGAVGLLTLELDDGGGGETGDWRSCVAWDTNPPYSVYGTADPPLPPPTLSPRTSTPKSPSAANAAAAATAAAATAAATPASRRLTPPLPLLSLSRGRHNSLHAPTISNNNNNNNNNNNPAAVVAGNGITPEHGNRACSRFGGYGTATTASTIHCSQLQTDRSYHFSPSCYSKAAISSPHSPAQPQRGLHNAVLCSSVPNRTALGTPAKGGGVEARKASVTARQGSLLAITQRAGSAFATVDGNWFGGQLTRRKLMQLQQQQPTEAETSGPAPQQLRRSASAQRYLAAAPAVRMQADGGADAEVDAGSGTFPAGTAYASAVCSIGGAASAATAASLGRPGPTPQQHSQPPKPGEASEVRQEPGIGHRSLLQRLNPSYRRRSAQSAHQSIGALRASPSGMAAALSVMEVDAALSSPASAVDDDASSTLGGGAVALDPTTAAEVDTAAVALPPTATPSVTSAFAAAAAITPAVGSSIPPRLMDITHALSGFNGGRPADMISTHGTSVDRGGGAPAATHATANGLSTSLALTGYHALYHMGHSSRLLMLGQAAVAAATSSAPPPATAALLAAGASRGSLFMDLFWRDINLAATAAAASDESREEVARVERAPGGVFSMGASASDLVPSQLPQRQPDGWGARAVSGAAGVVFTVAAALRSMYEQVSAECIAAQLCTMYGILGEGIPGIGGAAAAAASTAGTSLTSDLQLVFRGLRLRVGLHSGPSEAEALVRYCKHPMISMNGQTTVVVVAMGGVVLASGATFRAYQQRRREGRGAQRVIGGGAGGAGSGSSGSRSDFSLVHLGDYFLGPASVTVGTAGEADRHSAKGDVGSPRILASPRPSVSTDAAMANGGDAPVDLYGVLCPWLLPRLAIVSSVVRARQNAVPGCLSAPAGVVAPVFCNVLGVEALLAWERVVQQRQLAAAAAVAAASRVLPEMQSPQPTASVTDGGAWQPPSSTAGVGGSGGGSAVVQQALGLLRNTATAAAARHGGYVVAVSADGGHWVLVFGSASSAVGWGLELLNSMLDATWPEGFLEHELTEEVYEDLGTAMLRPVPRTGRLDYVGRPMNRAARIAAKAKAATMFVSGAVWKAARNCLEHDAVSATCLGLSQLKGVRDQVELWALRSAAATPSQP
ncbi:hypothetical protein VOLCADRAFT_103346 [Volvox carteri f. nagariensis]|uniref:Uncharacterized protein n=1 Tax=Volvox carteri f. nagariensis TaxID=3068 RepID=D8TLC9_VOLCA|nr:uncharacterized protein VOLCADRAFT_103346 [Volvox carteri f. nagariensis]EFJ51851.1 hypothetical protein VOLCADRAFT_103346 [Volvox carteri f. nagariensis]|eukprot:XP_002947261.1 hypothetical protein VOLCADRAFT_103346 [Volvox carteri f. nagariensis]